MSDFAFDVEEASFEALVRQRSHQTPVLLDISADWCAPCRVLAPLLHKLVDRYQGRFLLAMVDADENMRIAGAHKVRGFPTVVAYSGGEEFDRFFGAQPERFLTEFIDRLVSHHAALSANRH